MRVFFHKLFQEVLLNSGQYALFYILMNFSKDGIFYFNNLGHVILLIAIIFQTVFLVKYGSDAKMRFFGSLIAPLVYTLVELPEGPTAIFNTAHVLFWVFSIITAGIQARSLVTKDLNNKKIYEVFLVMINVIIFLCVYLYFDLYLTYNAKVLSGTMTVLQMKEGLEFYNLSVGMLELLKDAAHIYIIIAGLFLGATIAWSRVQIISLKDKIHTVFGEYVDESVRDKILEHGLVHGKSLLSEKKEVTILFSDIRGFTTISEKNTPEKITTLLNTLFSSWDEHAKKHNGIIDKFIGDAVMITFENPQDAIDCGVEFLKNLNELNNTLHKQKLPSIQIGVGIHCGTVIAGTIGSKSRKNYTIIGDPVNTASRLESLCKEYTTNLIISKELYNTISNKKSFIPLGVTQLKGKKNKMKIYGLK